MFPDGLIETTEARLASATDIAGFRSEARHLLAHQVPPERVRWCAPAAGSTACAQPEPRLQAAARMTSSIVPASFVRLCEYVVQHRDADRFDLLYRLLWRLVHEPALRHDTADPDISRAQHMAHAVRRDIHKLKSQLRLRPIEDPEHPAEPIHMAWCDPAHHVVDSVATWLARQQPATRWALLTPEQSVLWDGSRLQSRGGSAPPLSATAPDSEWLARWRSVFGDAG